MRACFVCIVVATATTAANATPRVVPWGTSGDVPLPRDFDGDGYADFAVWHPSTGEWQVKTSVTNATWTVQWGAQGDVPVPGDYDNDGVIDYAVWRPSNGGWYVKSGRTQQFVRFVQWGIGSDIPVPGDYDADGKLDFAIWRPSTGTFWVADNTLNFTWTQPLGTSGDIPVVGDFDGVRGDDFAIWHPPTASSSATWLTIGGLTGGIGRPEWGGEFGDLPTNGRFCSDHASKTSWRPSNGTWWAMTQPVESLGQPGDIPVPANYDGDWAGELAVWRPSDGTWNIETSRCDRWTPVYELMVAATQHTKGITMAAVKNGQVRMSWGTGMANDTTLAGPDVVWQLASISKLFVGTSLMIMVDAHMLDLDAPTSLRNPINKSTPKLRDFANHTSGTNGGCYGSTMNGIEPSKDLAKDTAGLATEKCWFDRPPGSPTYSSIGAAWPARFIEENQRYAFWYFTHEYIFRPLGMTSTGWFGTDFPGRPLAIGYWPNGTKTNEHGVFPYPAGNLRSTANDLAKFMIMMTNNGAPILTPAAVTTALTQTTASTFGVNWMRRGLGNRSLWGHNGVLAGVCNQLDIDPVKHDGVVILTNANCDVIRTDMDAIERRAHRILDEM